MPLAESSATLLIAACLGVVTSLLAAVMPDAATAAGVVIMDDSRLRLICVAGSLGGSVVGVMLFAVATHRELARKLTVSSISGVVFSPWLIRYAGGGISTDYVLVISAITALLSWPILQTAIPLVITKVLEKIGIMAGVKPPEN